MKNPTRTTLGKIFLRLADTQDALVRLVKEVEFLADQVQDMYVHEIVEDERGLQAHQYLQGTRDSQANALRGITTSNARR